MVSTKDIYKILLAYTNRSHHDPYNVWSDWLSWLCENLEWRKVLLSGGYPERFAQMKDENEDFFNAMVAWMEFATQELRKGKIVDSFGAIYEENYQSYSKAKFTGQFFTPMGLCECMAKMTMPEEARNSTLQPVHYNDCACGSGRTLLAMYQECNRYNRNFFIAGDIDFVSVHMCALNFFVSGIVGLVERRDALSQQWYGGYIVNAGKVPCYNNGATFEYFTDYDEYTNRRSAMYKLIKEWDIVKFNPNVDKQLMEDVCDSVPIKVECPAFPKDNPVLEYETTPPVKETEQVKPTIHSGSEAIQMSLFDTLDMEDEEEPLPPEIQKL